MKSQKRRNIVFLCMTCLLILVTIISSGCSVLGSKKEIPIPEVQKDVYVYDQDDIIDDETEQKLNKLLIQLESKTTAEVAVITTQSLLNMEIEDYSYKVANTCLTSKNIAESKNIKLEAKNITRDDIATIEVKKDSE